MTDPEKLTDIAIRVTAAEAGLAALFEAVARECPNTHQVHRDLELARNHFEDGFGRLAKAVAAERSPWVVRQYG
jgi:hypothetical protein